MPQENQTKIEKLREKISQLKKELERATLEKGLAAEENKDLRENSMYDSWEEKETMYTIRIHKMMKEIRDLTPKNPSKKPSKKHKTSAIEKIKITPRKWL